MAEFPRVRLGEFLTERKEFFTIDDLKPYKRARVQVHGKGIVLRDEVQGAEVKTKKQQAAKTGDLLVAEIDAKVGGFGIMPSELDGAIVSSHYFLFQINESKCLWMWLDWFIRSGLLEEQVNAQGSTNYAAIRPNHVLEYEIPLPPLPEQQRIIARIDAIARQVEEARGLRQNAMGEAESIMFSSRNEVVTTLRQKYADVTLGEVCVKITDGPHVSPIYVPDGISGIPFVSVRNISETGLDFSTAKYVSQEHHESYSKKAHVERGDVLYTKGGTTGVARRVDTDQEFSIWVHVALLKLNREIAVDAFVEHMLNSPSSKAQAMKYTHGSSNKDLGLTRMCNIAFPLPPLDEQRRLIAYLDGLQEKMSELRHLQAETQKELNALMPSVLARAFAGEL